MMTTPDKFLNARLDEWERLGDQAYPFQTGSRDEGQPVEHVSWRRGPGSVEFGLRHVATLRAIVANHVYDQYGCESCEYPGYCPVLALAADFSTHPDYRQEWARGAA